MGASDFSVMPTWVYDMEPEFNVIVSDTENLKKDRQVVSADAVYKYKLVFKGIADSAYKTIRDHFVARKGGYESFLWKNAYIPTYLKTLLGITTTDITCRWVEGTLSSTPAERSWDVDIEIEVEA